MKTFSFAMLCGIFVLFTAQTMKADDDVCRNGGEPLTGNHQKCSCPRGYKGYDCSQKVTPCEGEPCRNLAKCEDTVDGTFFCKCPANYEGVLCERRVRPCDRKPCQNGGNCTDDGVKCFKCECTSGFKGFDCSEKILPCEVSPCKHGGICSNLKEGGFKCACKNGYGGVLCDKKDALYSSKILAGNNDYVEQLQEWLGDDEDWSLCYRATRDGWKAADFHSRCDYKGPTVTIVRVGDYIFGGYADLPWGGSAAYKASTKCFVFSLRNKDNLPPFKSPVVKSSAYAIYTNPGYGPTFGSGHDFYIANNAYTTAGSYSNLGAVYQLPKTYTYGSAKAQALLAGSYKFLPNEVEVYYLR